MEEEFDIYESRMVTLEEMYNIYNSKAYKYYRERTSFDIDINDQGDNITDYIEMAFDGGEGHYIYPLLCRHIIAEQFLREHNNINWDGLSFPDHYELLMFVELWKYPLTWSTPEDNTEIVSVGPFAAEARDYTRTPIIEQALEDIQVQRLQRFIKSLNSDDVSISYDGKGIVKNVHDWADVTRNDYELERQMVLCGKRRKDLDSEPIRSYSEDALLRNLNLVKNHIGLQEAKYLLLTLQKEWKQLRAWHKNTEGMSDEELNRFESVLFHGFDEFMKEWKEPSCDFKKLITAPDPEKVLEVLHRRIDGRKGKAVGIVLAAATYKPEYKVLSRTPTEEEFNREFPDVLKSCKWRSISEWLKKVNDPKELRKDIQEVILPL